uniref:UPAR/Ly6 domain-containing protein n=1 Tax=Acrobeloides nanus TaxID=290746 RepID=A0A914D9V7_9BILA
MFLALLVGVNSLKCFNSGEEHECKSTNYCVKMINLAGIVTRRCDYHQSCQKDRCKFIGQSDDFGGLPPFRGTLCCCQEDLCNSAPDASKTLWQSVLIFGVAVFVTYLY